MSWQEAEAIQARLTTLGWINELVEQFTIFSRTCQDEATLLDTFCRYRRDVLATMQLSVGAGGDVSQLHLDIMEIEVKKDEATRFETWYFQFVYGTEQRYVDFTPIMWLEIKETFTPPSERQGLAPYCVWSNLADGRFGVAVVQDVNSTKPTEVYFREVREGDKGRIGTFVQEPISTPMYKPCERSQPDRPSDPEGKPRRTVRTPYRSILTAPILRVVQAGAFPADTNDVIPASSCVGVLNVTHKSQYTFAEYDCAWAKACASLIGSLYESYSWARSALRGRLGSTTELPAVIVDKGRDEGMSDPFPPQVLASPSPPPATLVPVEDTSPEPQASSRRTPEAPSSKKRQPRPSITFLHVSDFHQGVKEQDWVWPDVRNQFLEDLTELLAQSGPLDLVLFTGDLTQSGKKEEFDKLDATLDAIWPTLARGGYSPHLLVVPGNHDLVRPPERRAENRLLEKYHEDSDLAHEFWSEPDGQYRRFVREVFSPFSEWWSRTKFNTLKPKAGALPGDFSHTFAKGDLKLGIVGLNTASLQLKGGNYEKKLVISPRQIQEACGSSALEWTKEHDASLLLTHHPETWLHASAQADFDSSIFPPGSFTFYLSGHTHDPSSQIEALDGAALRNKIRADSLCGLDNITSPEGARIDRRHGYNVQKLTVTKDHVKAQIWPRRIFRHSSSGAWRVQANNERYVLQEDRFFMLEARRPRKR